MNDRHRAALDMIYPLADTLQMRLILNVRGEAMRIVGDQKIKLPVREGFFDVPAEIVVKASRITPKESWVLLHVRENLWIFLAYLQGEKELYFWIIDAEKISPEDRPKTGGIYQDKDISYCVEKLGPGAVAIYRRKKDETNWTLMGAGE